MGVHKWTTYFLVFWVFVMADDQCPLTCSGTKCYLIYTEDGKWKYKEPSGDVHYKNVNVEYPSPNCYQFIEVDNTWKSCYDAQQECEDVGGNITVINSKEEYDQLTDNILTILSVRSSRRFNVHVPHILLDLDLEKGCAQIYVYDGVGLLNTVEINNIDCSAEFEANAIVCESTDLNTEICPTTTTKVNPPSTQVTSTQSPFSMQTSAFTNWSTRKATSKTTEKYSTEPQSKSPQVPVTVSVVIVMIISIIILSFLFVRRIKRRNALKASQKRVTYSNGIGSHGNSTEQDSGDAYNILYTANTLLVENEAYDTPNQDNPAKDVTSNEEYDLINDQSVYSNQDNADLYALTNKNKEDSNKDLEDSRDIQPEPGRHTDHITTFSDGTLYENTKGTIQEDEREVYECLNDADMNAGKDVYAVPNENKESSNQDLEKVGKVQNAQDIQQQTERAEHIETFDDGRPALYENTIGNIQNEDEVYDCLNAADMFSEYDGYNELNAVGSDGIQSRISGDGTENEYGKLTKKNEQYSYVDTEINYGLVSNPGIGEHTYDKLQRN